MLSDKQASAAVLIALSLCLALAGCEVGPDFHPPQTTMPSSWSGPTSAPATAPASAAAAPVLVSDLAHWWKVFNDPTLSSLVDRAVKSNLDVQQAQARLWQARAARGVVAAGLGPTLDANGAFTRSRAPGVIQNLYQAGLDASWEIDVFGGVRRNVEAADADVQAARENLRGTMVTLIAEVALDYIDLRGFQQGIVIARENLGYQRHSAEVTRQKFRGGFVGALDVANADAQVATTAAQIPVLEQSVQQTIYSLSVLLAREPGALLKELSPTEGIPPTPPQSPVSVPSDLLRQRPDIRSAEAQLHGATARIGAATADLFPKFNITGSGAFQGDKLNNWFNWSNRLWSFGPSVSWTLFDTGRILSNIEVQKALELQSFLTYQQTVLTAMQDVENALIATAKEQEHRKLLQDAVTANRKAVELSNLLYAQGQTDFLNVLDAQRSLLSSQDALVQSIATVSTNLVALYKALGGGWSEEPASPSPTTKPATKSK